MRSGGGKTALVTGCLGFIGSHLCEALLARGDRVIGADLLGGSFEFFDRRIEFVPTDLTDPRSVQKLCETCPVDEVYHTASIFNYSTPKSVLDRVNLHGTQNLYCAIADTRSGDGRLKAIVHWSSGSINGRQPNGEPANEDDPLCPANDYERSKAEQEALVRELSEKHHLPIIYLRPAGVYGPRSRYGLARIIRLLAKGFVRCYTGNPRVRQSMVHVADIVGAALWLAGKPEAIGQAYNVADDAKFDNGQLTRFMAKQFQKWFVPVSLPLAAIKPAIALSETVAKLTNTEPFLIRDLLDHMEHPFLVSNQKLKATGYPLQFADTKVGLEQTIDWYRKAKWL